MRRTKVLLHQSLCIKKLGLKLLASLGFKGLFSCKSHSVTSRKFNGIVGNVGHH